jgi:serine/threonine protein kinase
MKYLVMQLTRDKNKTFLQHSEGKILKNFNTRKEAQDFINAEMKKNSEDYYNKLDELKKYNLEFIKNLKLPDNFKECYNFIIDIEKKGCQYVNYSDSGLPFNYLDFLEDRIYRMDGYAAPAVLYKQTEYMIVEEEE